jgi:hypothetical protein
MQAKDLPVALGVHTDRKQGVHVDGAPTLTDLEHQRVGGDERVRASIERPSAERLHRLVQRLGHLGHLRLGPAGDSKRVHQPVHPPRRDAEQVAGRHHADQRRLGTPLSF